MKKIILLSCFTLLFCSISMGQSPLRNNLKNITTEAQTLVKELSENISVSSYQQKSTQKVLVLAAQELEKINNSNLGASEKTIALEKLQKKKEYSLRMVLNDEQYAMLKGLMKE